MSKPTVSSPRPAAGGLLRDSLELLGSMRFAISLLVIICIASVVGTVLPQNRNINTYIDQFGPFWAGLFERLALYNVYNAWWFLVIMAFLVVSTSICVVRNAPKMLRDARAFRDHIRESSLRAFPHRDEQSAPGVDTAQAQARVLRWLAHRGYKTKVREGSESVLVAAKAGTANRWGYILAHTSIVMICVGGLFDSELPVRMQIWLGGKQPVMDNMKIADVPASGWLGMNNPGFRATVFLPEGGRTSNAVVMVGEGALVQPMPFELELKKFNVDYYSTGMPSEFASEVVVTDSEDGKSFPVTIKVNEPLQYKGVTVYQSSFDDGGSSVTLAGYPLVGTRDYAFAVDGVVGSDTRIDTGLTGEQQSLSLTFSALRPINVEDLARTGGNPEPRAFGEHVAAVTGTAVRGDDKGLRNVGPSVEYRLTDSSGQSHEFNNYMLPVMLDGASVFLVGTRANANDAFRYLRLPADANYSLAEFLALRAALADESVRHEAARRFAVRNAGPGADSRPLEESARRALDVFAADGLQGVTQFLEQNVPADELRRAAEIVVRLIGGAMSDVRAQARERSGLSPVALEGPAAEADDNWLRLSVAALSDLALYPAPVLLTLTTFNHLQASVFQVSRTPGKPVVYLGCLLLILGVFAMFYIRERRVWVFIKPEADGVRLKMAMTAQRRTMDFEREFTRLKSDLGRLCASRNPDAKE